MYGGAPWGAQKASVPEKLLRGALSGPGAPRPVRAGATPPSPYALRTSPRAAATTGGRLPRLPAQLRPRSVRSSQDAETLRSSPQATVAIGAASVGAQTESQRVPGLIRRRPADRPVIMRTRICLCGCASGMRLLWAECRLGRAVGQGVLPGLAGAAPRGQQPRCRCGEAVRYVARPRQAELRSGARPGRLRRCSALSLWAAWAADPQAFLLNCSTCPDCCGGCSGGLWLRRSALGHRDRPRRLRRPTALRARWSSWPGRCPPARPSRRRLLVWCGARAAGQVVCLASECTGTPCFVALVHVQCTTAVRWSTEVACCAPLRH